MENLGAEAIGIVLIVIGAGWMIVRSILRTFSKVASGRDGE